MDKPTPEGSKGKPPSQPKTLSSRDDYHSRIREHFYKARLELMKKTAKESNTPSYELGYN